MKRLTIALSGALLLAGLTAGSVTAIPQQPPAVEVVNVQASPHCGSYTELILYGSGNQTGTVLGWMCGNRRLSTPQSGMGTGNTYNYDEDMGDSAYVFQGGDNDNAASFKFYNPTGGTWCLVFYNSHDGAQLGGELVYDHLSPTATWWGPAGGLMTGLINEASAVQMYHKTTFESGDCNGTPHQTL